MGRRRYGLRWTPPGRTEQTNWYDSRDERDEHYTRVRQVGHAAAWVRERRSRHGVRPSSGGVAVAS